MAPLLYTVTDAAKLLNISRATIKRWIAKGFITPVELNGRRRVPASEISRVSTPASSQQAA